MSNILIFGNSGSGKSTLAKLLSVEKGLAHLDLDTLAWKESSPPERRPLEESAKLIENFTKSHTQWVIEGCYTDLLELLAPTSTEIIFLDLPVSACISNAKKRPWEPHKYPSKAAQDANLEMLLDWIAQYESRSDTFSKETHQKFYNDYSGTKKIYSENATPTKL